MKSSTQTIKVLPQRRHDVVDLTDDLRRAIKDSGVTDGCVVAFCAHTTCALMINVARCDAEGHCAGKLRLPRRPLASAAMVFIVIGSIWLIRAACRK